MIQPDLESPSLDPVEAVAARAGFMRLLLHLMAALYLQCDDALLNSTGGLRLGGGMHRLLKLLSQVAGAEPAPGWSALWALSAGEGRLHDGEASSSGRSDEGDDDNEVRLVASLYQSGSQ